MQTSNPESNAAILEKRGMLSARGHIFHQGILCDAGNENIGRVAFNTTFLKFLES